MERDNLKRQTFENTFFQMLRLLNEIVDSIEKRVPNFAGVNRTETITLKGRDALASIVSDFESEYNRLSQKEPESKRHN